MKKRIIELSESKHMNRGQEQGDREKNKGLVGLVQRLKRELVPLEKNKKTKNDPLSLFPFPLPAEFWRPPTHR
jgi:hypothetical protein